MLVEACLQSVVMFPVMAGLHVRSFSLCSVLFEVGAECQTFLLAFLSLNKICCRVRVSVRLVEVRAAARSRPALL